MSSKPNRHPEQTTCPTLFQVAIQRVVVLGVLDCVLLDVDAKIEAALALAATRRARRCRSPCPRPPCRSFQRQQLSGHQVGGRMVPSSKAHLRGNHHIQTSGRWFMKRRPNGARDLDQLHGPPRLADTPPPIWHSNFPDANTFSTSTRAKVRTSSSCRLCLLSDSLPPHLHAPTRPLLMGLKHGKPTFVQIRHHDLSRRKHRVQQHVPSVKLLGHDAQRFNAG